MPRRQFLALHGQRYNRVRLCFRENAAGDVAVNRADEAERSEIERPERPPGIRTAALASPGSVVSSGRFVTSIGFYLVLPFLAIYVTRDLGMSSAEAGVLLGVLNISRRGLAIPSGAAADRFGPVRVMVAGLLVEVIAYSLFATARAFPLWVVAVIVHGAGGSMNNMGARGVLASGDRRAAAAGLSGYYIMINAAALISPLVGGILLQRDLVRVSMAVAAVLHLLFAIGATVLLDGLRSDHAREPAARLPGWRDGALREYCVLTLGCWFLLSQLYLAVPLAVGGEHLSVTLIGYLNAANAAVVMLAVLGMRGWTAGLTSDGQVSLLQWSPVVLGLGWLACLARGSTGLFAAVATLSVGEALFVSVVDVLAVQLAPAGQRATYLGYSSLSWAVGAGAGGLLGGSGYALASDHHLLWAYWVSFTAIGCLSTVALTTRREALRSALRTREARSGDPTAA
jgi:MFS family permease